MKNIITILTAIFLAAGVFAQSPQKMSYQAVIRNNNNVLVTSQPVGMRISILQGSASGTAVYVETQTPVTNLNGLASLEIGSGTVVSGTFAAINWSNGPYFINTETDPTGGTNYSITGTSQLLSVPYALYAENSGDTTLWLKNNNDIYYSKGNVGIKTNSPLYPLQVNGDIYLADRGSKLIFGSGVGAADSIFAIYRPLGTDGIMIEATDLYFRSHLTPIQLQSFSSIDMMDLTGHIRMIVNSQTGNVGIGTTSPARTLHVNSVMRLEPIPTAPSLPAKGDIYFDSTLNKLRVYDGTTWQNCW